MDVLSDAIAAMRTGRPSSSRLRVNSPWCYRFDRYDGAGFHVLLHGTGWLVLDDGEPTYLASGDIVLLPRGTAHVLSDTPRADNSVPFDSRVSDDPLGDTEFLCGKYRLDHTRMHPALAELPDVVHVPARARRHGQLSSAIELLTIELAEARPGREAVITGLLDLLLTYLIRAWLDDNDHDGWPRALRNRYVAAALAALHDKPDAPWRVEDLAAHVGVSRATLARKFTALTGRSPMAYLTWWRMTTAAGLLRTTDRPLAAVARQVGYSSPFAFSHAFKRHFGVTPGRYRAQGDTTRQKEADSVP